MPTIPLLFMTTAAFCLIVGIVMGIVMGLSGNFTLAPVHAHLNLLGWGSLAVMGLTYRVWPALAERRRWAVTQFALSASGAVLMPAGIWLAVTQQHIALAVTGSIAWLLGAVLFLAQLLRGAGRVSPR
jgi:cbb3-type cytochrome oxidase subunit 1